MHCFSSHVCIGSISQCLLAEVEINFFTCDKDMNSVSCWVYLYVLGIGIIADQVVSDGLYISIKEVI